MERQTGKKYKKKYVPVNIDLKEFLNQQGWQELKGTDKYIIAPFRKVKTRTLTRIEINKQNPAFAGFFIVNSTTGVNPRSRRTALIKSFKRGRFSS